MGIISSVESSDTSECTTVVYVGPEVKMTTRACDDQEVEISATRAEPSSDPGSDPVITIFVF